MREPLKSDDRLHHDLKNQLGIIMGFSELLLKELAEEDPRRADLEEIHCAGQRALDLLGGLPAATPHA